MKKKASPKGHFQRTKRQPVDASKFALRWWSIITTASVSALAIVFAIILTTPTESNTSFPQVDETEVGGANRLATPEGTPAKSLEFPTASSRIVVSELTKELHELAERLQTEYADEPSAHHVAAQIYSSFKQTDQAELAWRKCIELGASGPGPFVGLAEQLFHEGEISEAIEILNRGQQLGFRTPEMQLVLAESYESEGRLDSAREVLEQASRDFPDAASLWLARGRVLNQLSEFSQSEECLQRNISLVGKSEAALVLLNTAQIRQGKRDAAAATRDEIASLRTNARPTDAFQETYEATLQQIAVEVISAAGSLAEKHGRLNEAFDLYWRALELSPLDGKVCTALATVVRKQGRQLELLQIHQYLVQVEPDNLLNHLNLASVALQVGDQQLAESSLERAISQDPRGYMAQAAMARLLSALARHDDAVRYAKMVVERNPSAEALLLLAHVYRAGNKVDLAELAIAEARQLDPSNPIWTKSVSQ